MEKMHKSIGDLAKSLVEIQLRAGMLNAQTVTCCNPLLTASHGPYGDLNAIFLPKFSTSLVVGANDIGVNTTYNVLLMERLGSQAHFGGGVLYSNLGAMVQYNPACINRRIRGSTFTQTSNCCPVRCCSSASAT